MTVVAGVDVGNSTTEVLLARVDNGRVEVVGVGRAPTRRGKGSPKTSRSERRLTTRIV